MDDELPDEPTVNDIISVDGGIARTIVVHPDVERRLNAGMRTCGHLIENLARLRGDLNVINDTLLATILDLKDLRHCISRRRL